MDSRLEKVLTQIAKKSAMKSPSFVCTYETGKGEGYMGIVKMFEITDEKQKLSVIVKLSPLADEIHRRLPMEHNCNAIQLVNSFYSDETKRQEMLIIENLKPIGYEVIDRTKPMKHDHMKLAFQELAKLHAVGYALKHKKPKVYQEMTDIFFGNMIATLYEHMGFDNFTYKLANQLKNLFKGSNLYDTYSNFVERIADEFHQTLVPDEYSVILHGDSWCNNFMYTHDDKKNPVSTLLIDFQLSMVLSPVQDLSYLFYGCVDVKLLPKFKLFLKYYYDQLKKTLRMFDLDVENVFPWSKLLEHWKKYSKYGFIIAPLMRIIMLSTSEESPDLSEAAKMDTDVMMAFLYKMQRENEYNESIKAVIRHYIEEKYI